MHAFSSSPQPSSSSAFPPPPLPPLHLLLPSRRSGGSGNHPHPHADHFPLARSKESPLAEAQEVAVAASLGRISRWLPVGAEERGAEEHQAEDALISSSDPLVGKCLVNISWEIADPCDGEGCACVVRRNNTERGETQGTQDASQATMGTSTSRQGNTRTTQTRGNTSTTWTRGNTSTQSTKRGGQAMQTTSSQPTKRRGQAVVKTRTSQPGQAVLTTSSQPTNKGGRAGMQTRSSQRGQARVQSKGRKFVNVSAL
ncbi:hypothetical protein RHGRI_019464 [Rhododendron griersonianum]|uniref:Uncharacterized protein n=1 Tax=Rhododendron griersonianum TaxID=479676 RepID=A0AAV6JCK6_9ERIC|nr:hypothetical protein RHGRI_019464 [Rhododendron griersonianum]